MNSAFLQALHKLRWFLAPFLLGLLVSLDAWQRVHTKERVSRLRTRYIDLLRASLTGTLHPHVGTYRPSFDELVKVPFDALDREYGEDWPIVGQTMVGNKRLRSLQELVESVINEGIPGDMSEFGVWRGGSSIFMAALVSEAGESGTRKSWVCDSFAGLPKAESQSGGLGQGIDDDRYSTLEYLRVPQSEVEANFQRYGLWNPDTIIMWPGFFRDSMPPLRRRLLAENRKIAVLRADGDMYASTLDVLYNLYELVSIGGYVIIDDYGIPECKNATDTFRSLHGIDEELVVQDRWGVFWRKRKAIRVELENFRKHKPSR